jgi:hypothetical protein
MKKRKGAAEFFELFKTRVKSTALGPNASVSAPTATVQGTAGAGATPAPVKESPVSGWLGPGDGKDGALESSTRLAVPETIGAGGGEFVSPGERTFTITMNVAVLIVLILLSASFAAFGIGVWYGKEIGHKETLSGQKTSLVGGDEVVLKTGTADDLLPSDRKPVLPRTNGKATTDRTEKKPADVLKGPGPGITKQPDVTVTSTQPARTRFYTVRLIDYDFDDQYGEFNAKRQVERLRGDGIEAAIRTITRDGKRRIAVCYGKFETEAAAEKVVPQFQRMGRGFGTADVILVEQKQ